MKPQQARALRGGARAAAGAAVVGIAAAATIIGLPLPEIVRQPLAIEVDTTQDTERTLVCPGSFGVLGADPTRPETAIPTGRPALVVAGEPTSTAELARAEAGDGMPSSMSAALAQPLGAAQLQIVGTDALRGAVADACAEPLNEQWLLGGASSLGVSTTLVLGNSGDVPATVRISVHDEHGPVDSGQTAGVTVQPGSTLTVPLNGYAPDRQRLAVRVVSTGAPVSASLGIGHSTGLDPFAVSSATRQQAPATELVIPGVAGIGEQQHRNGDIGAGDMFPVVVRVLAPDASEGGAAAGAAAARISALDAAGRSTPLGELALVPGAIGELSIPSWPKGANAVVVEADVPVVASAQSSATDGETHDYEWFTPAPPIAAGEEVAAPVVPGASLVLVNRGSQTAEVTIAAAKGKPVEVEVPAGAAITTSAPADGVLVSTQPLYAGVRYFDGGDIAGYPILAPDARAGELTVFTR